MNAKTSVICAVYSKDPDRHELLRQHNHNLAQQTCPVRPIYVFENSDPPPANLAGEIIVCSRSMTIYQAWNVALSACETPFVMNLNLDDRLNVDAVEVLERSIDGERADLVGGDWKICYSQEETNLVGPCFPAGDLGFSPLWPPAKGTVTRLGSGTGARGTYGPATMWRMSAHIGCPRYPYRTASGYLIQSVADAQWWHMLSQHFLKKLVRVPSVVGNYHSHPAVQAEFRANNDFAAINGDLVSFL